MTQLQMTSNALAGELQARPAERSRAKQGGRLLALGRGIDRFTPFGAVFPAANGPALAAYYLGIFSLVPLFGLLLAAPAVALGVAGVRRARRLPGHEGSGHAWSGVALGTLFGLVYLTWSLIWLSATLV